MALVTSSEAAVLQIWESETRCFLGCVTAGVIRLEGKPGLMEKSEKHRVISALESRVCCCLLSSGKKP